MIWRMSRWLTLVILVGFATGCNAPSSSTSTSPTASPATDTSPNAASGTGPKVVATHSVLCDMVNKIAQETVNLTCLVKAGMDPHVYEPTPSDRKALEDAALILYNGYNFEPSIMKLIESGAKSATKVAVAEQAVPSPLMGEEHQHHGGEHAGEKEAHGGESEADHDHGAEKGDKAAGLEPDPHVWHNAKHGIKMVAVVQSSLSKLLPDQTTAYKRNAEALTAQLQGIDVWIKSQISTVPANARKLVTTHDALGYFAAAYGVPVEGALQGLSTEQKPSAARVKELVNTIKSDQVPTIFAEVTDNPNLLNTIARDAGVKISEQELFADGLGEASSPGETYPKALIANTKAIVEGLGGRYTAFAGQ
jgi:manganese/iron transport system substrate-binding protein